jgi:hypothetical protein
MWVRLFRAQLIRSPRIAWIDTDKGGIESAFIRAIWAKFFCLPECAVGRHPDLDSARPGCRSLLAGDGETFANGSPTKSPASRLFQKAKRPGRKPYGVQTLA